MSKLKSQGVFDPLPISLEMNEWSNSKFETFEGTLPEVVSSVIVEPLNSISLFCSTAAVSKSNFSGRMNDQSDDNHDKDAIFDRLNVLWLQRRAKFEQDTGKFDKSISTLEKAIQIHLGSNNYDKANISDLVVSSDPAELHKMVETNFRIIDRPIHFIVARFQRFYRRRFIKRSYFSSMITHWFRKVSKIKRSLKLKNRLQQCAVIVQLRYRKRYVFRCKMATKLQRWYRRISIFQNYQSLKFFHSMARKIQSRLRGMIGRRKAAQENIKRQCAIIIQKYWRKYFSRAKRYGPLSLFHRVYFLAVRRIQCLVRRALARQRARKILVVSLAQEEARYRAEIEVMKHANRLAGLRTRDYLSTLPGKLHLRHQTFLLQQQTEYFQSIRHSLSLKEILTHEATICFGLFDVDGSGLLTYSDFHSLLLELGTSLSYSQTHEFFRQFHLTDQNKIYFSDFVKWYVENFTPDSSEDPPQPPPQPSEPRQTWNPIVWFSDFKERIFHHALHQVRATREIHRFDCIFSTREALSSFRDQFPPKFQCCQCRQPFVLFQDFYSHFHDGFCVTTGERGLFLFEYWIDSNWTNQLSLQEEILRSKDETSFLSYQREKSYFENQAILHESSIRRLLVHWDRAAQELIFEKNFQGNHSTDSEFEDISTRTERLVQSVLLCGSDSWNPNTIDLLSKVLGSNPPPEWSTNSTFDHSSIIGWVQDALSKKRSSLRYIQSIAPTIIKSRILIHRQKQESLMLGKLYSRSYLFLRSTLTTSIRKTLEFRSTRPRRLTLKDSTLILMGLETLTEINYLEPYSSFAKTFILLKTHQEFFDSVPLTHTSCFSNLPYFRSLFSSADSFEKLLSEASSNLYLHSPIGSMDHSLYSKQIRFELQSKSLFHIIHQIFQLKHSTSIPPQDYDLLNNLFTDSSSLSHFSTPQGLPSEALPNIIPHENNWQFQKSLSKHLAWISLLLHFRNQFRSHQKLLEIILVSLSAGSESSDTIITNQSFAALTTKSIVLYRKLQDQLLTHFSEQTLIRSKSSKDVESLLRQTQLDSIVKKTFIHSLFSTLGMESFYRERLLFLRNLKALESLSHITSSDQKSRKFYFQNFMSIFDLESDHPLSESQVLFVCVCLQLPQHERLALLRTHSWNIEGITQFLIRESSISIHQQHNFICIPWATGFALLSIHSRILFEMKQRSNFVFSTPQIKLNSTPKYFNSLFHKGTRSMLSAEKQVSNFLQTTFGKIQLEVLGHFIWVWRNSLQGPSSHSSSIALYVYQLHSTEDGVLISELPYLFQFIKSEFGLEISSNFKILNLLHRFYGTGEPHWMSRDQWSRIFAESLNLPLSHSIPIRSKLLPQQYHDPIWRMRSIARQQSILLSFRIGHLSNSSNFETHYRCSVLGLNYLQSTVNQSAPTTRIDFKFRIPREAASLLLLSYGYCFADLLEGTLPQLIGVGHSCGSLLGDLILAEEVLATAELEARNRMTIFQKLTRCVRAISSRKYTKEFRVVVTLMTTREEDIKVMASQFLKELIDGI